MTTAATSGVTGGDGGSTWEDVVWQPDHGLLARVHRPANRSAGATVLDVHGGAWYSRDRTLGQTYHEALAGAGLTVVAVDFRDGRNAKHPAAVDDIAAAIGWAIDDAGVAMDPDRFALTGSSSGGHLALHVALTATGTITPRLVAAFWPPVDPLARYRYARSLVGQPVPDGNRLDAAGLLAATEAYFGDETTMGLASIAEIVRSEQGERRATALPPVWLVQAGNDLNVPVSMLDELEQAYTAAGGHLERTIYPGEIHGFGHGQHEGAIAFRQDLVDRLTAALR